VLDFGIAKLIESFPDPRISQDATTVAAVNTEPGVIMGSPNYMSPEQARGLSVDARTDIFSFGVMLYEMITGARPFDGETASDIIVSVLDRQPPPMSRHAPAVPAKLEELVTRALAKDKQKRYQTVEEMRRVLKRQKQRLDFERGLDPSVAASPDDEMTLSADGPVAASGAAPSKAKKLSPDMKTPTYQMETARATSDLSDATTQIKRLKSSLALSTGLLVLVLAAIAYIAWDGRQQNISSLAVLPFVNAGGDPAMEYLSDGITESLINNLSQSLNLKVMSRNSVFRYKGRDMDAKVVGRELGVQSILAGKLIERGGELNISVELVDARDNSQIWGKKYGIKMADIFAVQEEISKQIADKLRLELTGDEQRRMARRYTDNHEAYRLYLRGRFHWNKRTEEDLKKGIDYFNQAIALDPKYALPYAGLADCYALLGEYGKTPMRETLPKAKAAAMRAVEIDDTLAEAHTSLAAVSEYEWNWPNAEREYQRAIELNPNYATAHHWYGVFLGHMGRYSEATGQIEQALELDPLSLIINTGLGRVLHNARRYDQAIEQLRKTIDMEESFGEAHFQLALAYEGRRMYPEALQEFERSRTLFQDPLMIAWVGRVHAVSGRRREAEAVLDQMIEEAGKQYVSPYLIAMIYAGLGEKDRAYEWLERMYEERSYYVTWLKVDPVFDPLRAEPRFQDLLRRIGLAS
jgi:serine/threonine-protein kinase